MASKVFWLRLSYWVGAIIDGFFAVAMLYPKLWGFVLGIPNFNPDVQHRVDLAVGAMLMLGWTFLLIWADRKPIERKDILALTVLVVAGFGVVAIAAITVGAATFEQLLPIFIMKLALITLFGLSLLRARLV